MHLELRQTKQPDPGQGCGIAWAPLNHPERVMPAHPPGV